MMVSGCGLREVGKLECGCGCECWLSCCLGGRRGSYIEGEAEA